MQSISNSCNKTKRKVYENVSVRSSFLFIFERSKHNESAIASNLNAAADIGF